MIRAFEVNFDGLVGPTHNYAGLSPGNLASQKHFNTVSHPKAAALQGLAKMKLLHDLGVKQAILPPHQRPHLGSLRDMGFVGTDAEVIRGAFKKDSRLLAMVYSSSAMWAANAATVSAAADTADRHVHFTPANLLTQFHRSLESQTTAAILRAIFPADSFCHHEPLPAEPAFADEGAANHMRLCHGYNDPGIEVFVYGRSAAAVTSPAKFPARQTLEASRRIANDHKLDLVRTIFAQQHPDAIDAGAFHNDVMAVGNQNVLLIHTGAFVDQSSVLAEVSHQFSSLYGRPLTIIEADAAELSLDEAVQAYVFNSQLVTLPNGSMSLIAPLECKQHPAAQRFLDRAIRISPIKSIYYQDVRQSMNNGGGPACQRLRVVLTDQQLRAIHPGVIFTDALYATLSNWIDQHYRESLYPENLADPSLIRESAKTAEGIYALLGLR